MAHDGGQRPPRTAGIARWILATRDAHGLYRQFGFESLSDPGRFMERFRQP